jgi:hypothetical protein
MKFVEPANSVDPDIAVRRLLEIANGVEAVQDGSTSKRSTSLS